MSGRKSRSSALELNTPWTQALSAAGSNFKGFSVPSTGKVPTVGNTLTEVEIVVIDDKFMKEPLSMEIRRAIFLLSLELLNHGREEMSAKSALCLFINMWNAYFPSFFSVCVGEKTGLKPTYVTVTSELAAKLATQDQEILLEEAADEKDEEGNPVPSQSKGKGVTMKRTSSHELGRIYVDFNLDDERDKDFDFDLGRYILALFVRTLAIRPDESNKTGFLSGRLDTFVRMHGLPTSEREKLENFVPDLKAMSLVYHTLVEYEAVRVEIAQELLKWHGQPPTDPRKQPIRVTFGLLDGAGWTYIDVLSALCVGCPQIFEWGPLKPMRAQVKQALEAYNRLPEQTRGYGKVIGERAKEIPTSNQVAAAVAVARHILIPTRPTLEKYYANNQFQGLVQDAEAWMNAQGLSSELVAANLKNAEGEGQQIN